MSVLFPFLSKAKQMGFEFLHMKPSTYVWKICHHALNIWYTTTKFFMPNGKLGITMFVFDP